MVKYTIERLLLAIVTTLVILTLTFFLIKQLPFAPSGGTRAQAIAWWEQQVDYGNAYMFYELQPQLGEPLAAYQFKPGEKGEYWEFFYATPAYKQYFAWLFNILQGKWGASQSVEINVDAMVIIGEKLPTTIKVNIWPVLVSVPLGILLGVWAALKKNKLTDHIISTLIMVFISVPSFIVLTFLMLWLCFQTGWLPRQWPSQDADIAIKIKAYIIPTLALSFGSICGYCRITRAELTEVMSSDFLLLARTKGLTKTQSITRHAMKNAMVPILPSILSEVIGLLGGSMILEKIYGIPGVGQLYIKAIDAKDYNVLMADMSFYTIIGLVSGVFLDLSYGFIDPRIRMGARK